MAPCAAPWRGAPGCGRPRPAVLAPRLRPAARSRHQPRTGCRRRAPWPARPSPSRAWPARYPSAALAGGGRRGPAPQARAPRCSRPPARPRGPAGRRPPPGDVSVTAEAALGRGESGIPRLPRVTAKSCAPRHPQNILTAAFCPRGSLSSLSPPTYLAYQALFSSSLYLFPIRPFPWCV